jgi:hypothetical protein
MFDRLLRGDELLIDAIHQRRPERGVGHDVRHGQPGEHQDDDRDEQLQAQGHAVTPGEA